MRYHGNRLPQMPYYFSNTKISNFTVEMRAKEMTWFSFNIDRGTVNWNRVGNSDNDRLNFCLLSNTLTCRPDMK